LIRRRADGRSRGRPEQRRTGGRRAGCRRRAAEFQVRPILSPLPSLLSFLRSLSLPALKRCGGPRAPALLLFPCARKAPARFFQPFSRARDRLTLRVASSRCLSDALAREATPYERRAWRRRHPNLKLAWTPRRRLGDAVKTMFSSITVSWVVVGLERQHHCQPDELVLLPPSHNRPAMIRNAVVTASHIHATNAGSTIQ